MAAPDILSAEIRVAERLREHRKARRTYLAARDLLLEAIAERDTMRASHDGEAMTCEHGHAACAVGLPNYCGDEHQ